MWRRALAMGSALGLAVAAASCGGDDQNSRNSHVVVLAAASLTDVFTDLATAFESSPAGDDVDVELSFGASSSLRVQITEGAPADVFASASTSVMDGLDEAGELLGSSEIFAMNVPVIAVPADNPAGVQSLDDFARSELTLGVCARQVPCGSYAADLFDAAGIEPSVDTEETDVRSLTAKIAAGELDAGIVYATDVRSSNGALVALSLPSDVSVDVDYPIAVLSGSSAPAAATAFVDFVLSDAGRAILVDNGFIVS